MSVMLAEIDFFAILFIKFKTIFLSIMLTWNFLFYYKERSFACLFTKFSSNSGSNLAVGPF